MDLLQAEDEVDEGLSLRISYTSDTHSYIYPTDYVGEGGKAMGYMLTASSFTPGSVRIDGGDSLQGSPLVRHEMKKGLRPFLTAQAFNAAGLDVYVPGNHDFDFGYDTLRGFLTSLEAHVVCANLADKRGALGIGRHVIIERDGVRLFITGAVTDYVNIWDGTKLDGLEVQDALDCLKKEYEESLEMDVDFRICVYHGGFSDGDSKGPYIENRAGDIAKLGFDVLLTGHQHQQVEPHFMHGTLVLQAGCKATTYAEVELEKGRKPEAWILKPAADTRLSPAMEALKKADTRQAGLEVELGEVLGHVDGVLEDRSRLYSYLHGSTLADYINDIQMAVTGADVSAASLFNEPTSLGPEVRLADVLKAYPFSNSLVLVEIEARQLKKAMERSASFAEMNQEGLVVESPSFSPMKDERYNFDFYRGLSYSYDLSKEPGSRVVRMRFKDIDLLADPGYKLRMVLNSYRSSGTGGYDIYREVPVLQTFSTDIQDVLIASFEQGVPVKVPGPTDIEVIL